MDSTGKARQLLTELLEPGVSPRSANYKILLLGIRDAYEYHRDLLMEGEEVDKAEQLVKYYQEALQFWRDHDRERAIYYLGGALYHLQDAWLGLSEDPYYEEYLEKALEWGKNSPPPELARSPSGSLEAWVEEAESERRQFDALIQQLTSQSASSGRLNPSDQISLYLAQRAQAAGAALLLQFFLEVTAES